MPESVAVKVVGRCRPLTPEEAKKGEVVHVKAGGDKVIIEAGKEQSFGLDGAYGPDATNDVIYRERCEQLVHRAMEGNNVTIMAYGACGSGKSMLMSGSDSDAGLVYYAIRSIFDSVSRKSGQDFLLTVSYLEITDEKMLDLLNPHSNKMTIRQHPTKGLFVDGLSELVVKNADDITQFFEQGTRARKIGASDNRSHKLRSHAVFSVVIEQREKQSSKVGVRSVIHFVDTAGFDAGESSDPDVIAGLRGLQHVIAALGGPRKGSSVPYRDSKLTRYLQESLGGNAITMIIATLSPIEKGQQSNLVTLQFATFARNIKNKVKLNLDDTNDVISELRDEISKLRDKISAASEPTRDDILTMEDLVKDLQIAKKQTWEEKQHASAKYEEERKLNLANKGILEWVTDNMKKGNKEMREKIQSLQKEKDQVTAKYREKRNGIDQLKAELQSKIAQYSKFAEKGKTSDSENKALVSSIHSLKERLKHETDKLKLLKFQLNEIDEKQQLEKEGARAQITALKGNAEVRQKVEREERHKLEAANKATIEEELERAKFDIDAHRAEVQMRAAQGKTYSTKEGAELEIKVAEMRAEKGVVTTKIQCLEQEKEKVTKDLESMYILHKEELELQQLQHYQTFRNYREMFEEQKSAIEQRYRHLLEDSVQDAVFLSARNNELSEENTELRQSINEMKDVITKLGGRIPSSVEHHM